MPRDIQYYLDHYGESHQNPINKLIHWFCIPAIMFSLFGLLYSIPFPGGKSALANWAFIVFLASLLYYLRLSIMMSIGFIIIGLSLVLGNHFLNHNLPHTIPLVTFSIVLFVIAWIIQFVGHKIEGKKPSFIEDVQYLLIGPAWLLAFIFKKVGIKY